MFKPEDIERMRQEMATLVDQQMMQMPSFYGTGNIQLTQWLGPFGKPGLIAQGYVYGVVPDFTHLGDYAKISSPKGAAWMEYLPRGMYVNYQGMKFIFNGRQWKFEKDFKEGYNVAEWFIKQLGLLEE